MNIQSKNVILLTVSTFLVLSIFCSFAYAEKGRSGQIVFKNAEDALVALKTALKAEDSARLTEIFGKESRKFFYTGDTVGDAITLRSLSSRFDQRAELLAVISKDYTDEQWYLVRYGIEGWNLHVPLVNRGQGWTFATEYASDADMKRRRALNEVATVDTLRTLVRAQKIYKSKDRNGDGILEYAQKFGSSPGKQDGLYWQSKEGQETSPIDGMIVKALQDGYTPSSKGTPTYYGYVYKLLKAQGGKTRGGKKSYLSDGRMVDGFAILAYPLKWNISGDMTFLVAADGQVWKKDLGIRTESVASRIESMDMDYTWARVDPMSGGENSRQNW